MASNQDLLLQAFDELNVGEKSDIKEYRKLLNLKYMKDEGFDISSSYHQISKRFKFTFYENGDQKSNLVYLKEIDGDGRNFLKLFLTNDKKIEQFKKQYKTEKIEIFKFTFLCGYYFLMTLSAYMIEKFKDEEDKNKTVNEFELDINKLLNDALFLSYCKKFNKDAKENNYDLLK